MIEDNIILSEKLDFKLVNYFSNLFKNKSKAENLVIIFKNNILKLSNSIKISIQEKNENKILRNLHSLKGVFNSASLTDQGSLVENIENNFKKEKNLTLLEKDILKFFENLKG